MLGKFRTLLGHTMIYGLGNYGIKIIGFLLIPLYTRYLTTTDYGVMSLVSIFTQAMFILVNMGQSTSVFRFYYDHDTPEERERVIASSLWIIILFSAPFALVPLLAPHSIANHLLGNPALWYLIVIGTFTVLCKVLLRMPFQMMRAEQRSKNYALWSVARNGITTLMSVLMVAVLYMGATGVVLAQFVGEFIMCVLLAGGTLATLRAGFDWKGIKEQLKYGLPLVPAGAAAFTLDLVDRWFLKHYYSVADVGIYSLGYRFGEIITFVVTAFQLSWPQFIFQHRKEPDAPELYANMATYYTAFLFFLWLGLSAFSDDMLKIMATPAFYPAASIIPLIAFALALDGLTFMVKVGILISKKMLYRTAVIFIAAGLALPLNFLLIPTYGMMGAAWAKVLGFGAQVLFTLYFSQRLYRVPYPYAKIGVVMGAAVAIYGLAEAVRFDSVYASIAYKSALMPLYPAALFAVGLFERRDIAKGFDWLGGRVPRAAPALRRLRPLFGIPSSSERS